MADAFVAFVAIQPSASTAESSEQVTSGSSPVRASGSTVKHGAYGGRRKKPVIK